MNKKMAMYAIVISLLSLSFAGASLAHWTKVITVTGAVTSGSVSWEWSDDFEPYFREEGQTKEIAHGSVVAEGDTLLVTLCNVYPSFQANIGGYIDYTGTVPGMFLGVRVLVGDQYIKVYDAAGAEYDIISPKTVRFLRLNSDPDENVFEITMTESMAQLHMEEPPEETSFFIHALEPLMQDMEEPNCEAEYVFTFEFTVINYNEYDSQHPEDPVPIL